MAISGDYAGYMREFGSAGHAVGPTMGGTTSIKMSDGSTLIKHSNAGGTYFETRYPSGGGGGVSTASTTSGSGYSYSSQVKAAQEALGYKQKAEDTVSGMVSQVQDALRGVLGGGTNIDEWLNKVSEAYVLANDYARQGAESAGKITNVAADVSKQAGKITNVADQMGALSPKVEKMGAEMYATGADLLGTGKGLISDASGILKMDPNAGGLYGTYIQALMALDPSLAVSQAVTDTQKSFSSAKAQAVREQARRGVSPGSGSSAALQAQLSRALATALATIKTKTRQSANTSYLTQLGEALKLGNDMTKTGADIVSSGVTAQGQGVAATKGAADILAQQAGAYAQGAAAYGTAGQLLAAQANAYSSAANATTATGNLAVSAANAQTAANNSQIGATEVLLKANTSAAEYYASMFNNYATIAGDRLFDGASSGGGGSKNIFESIGSSIGDLFGW